MTMDCRSAKALIPACLMGDLAAAPAEEVRAHLAGCPRCAAHSRELRAALNLLGDDVFPYTTPGGATYDVGAYRAALDLVLESAGYDELRAAQAERRASGSTKALGIGQSLTFSPDIGQAARGPSGRPRTSPNSAASNMKCGH